MSDNKNIDISIIVPIYNLEKYLDDCILSILNQTFTNFELILIDDGSVDRSLEICNYYKKYDDRIKVISITNHGLSYVRNYGLKIAKGDFIMFVDGDDYIDKDTLKILFNLIIQKDNIDIVIANFEKVDEINNVISKKNENINNIEIINNTTALERLITLDDINYKVVWGKLYKRKIFNNIIFPEGKQNEDEFVIHRMYYNANNILCINTNLYKYRIRINSIMNSTFLIKNFDKIHALNERVKFLEKVKLDDLKYKAEHLYTGYFINFYIKGMKELINNRNTLRKEKLNFILNMYSILNNKVICKKEKILLLVFAINYKLYIVMRKVIYNIKNKQDTII